MECRIELTSEAPRAVVTITGRLAGEAIEQLRGLRRSIEGAATLDLAGLVSADDEGVEAIRAMSLKGYEIRNASPFVQLLLQNGPQG
jgi:hypothetical protein